MSDVSPNSVRGRIAISFAEIAQHLVIGAILFHDIDYVLDWRRAARPRGYRITGGNVGLLKPFVPI